MSRSPLALLCLTLAIGACRHDGPDRTARTAAQPDGATAEAERLAGEIFQLVDRAADYQSSHRGRLPQNVAQLGIDSLTRTTVRRLIPSTSAPAIQVGFRHPAGHTLRDCRADRRILEEASLNAGQFTVTCTAADGSSLPYQVGGG